MQDAPRSPAAAALAASSQAAAQEAAPSPVRGSELRDRFIIALDEAVRPLVDPAEITAVCARLLGEHLQASRCAYAEVLDDEDTFDLTGDHNRGVASIVGRYRFADFGGEVLRLMREGKPYVVSDVQTHQPPVGDLSAYRLTAIRAVVCVPLRKAGRLVAAMAVHQSAPRAWRSDEIDLVLHVTNRCLESIEHARALRRLKESEERFRAAAAIASSIVWTNDAQGRMRGEQPHWQAFTGQSRQECHDYGWSNAVHPQDAPGTVAAWQRAVATRTEFVYQHRVRRSDGAYRACQVRALPLLDAAGQVREWVGVHTDVTDRLAFEQALQESESRFRNLSDNAPVMIWVTRPDGHCEHLNRRWHEFTGQTREEAEGFGWLQPVHPDDAPEAERVFLEANAAGRAFSLEYRLRRRDGEYRWCIDSALPRLGFAGERLGYIGSVIDITERKRTENALAAEKKALELIATGSPLHEVLDAIVRGAEAQSTDGIRCSILVLDAAGELLRLGAAPSLPDDYNAAIDGLRIGPAVGSCGTAAYSRRMVVATDVQTDPCWEAFRELAARHGLGACCSMPIITANGRLQGTVAMYYDRPHMPSGHDLELSRSVTHLAGVVLEKHRLDARLQVVLEAEQQARAQAEQASRTKDEFLATLSHELRTPLNAIIGWASILRQTGGADPALTKGVDVIERNAKAQAQIIADLLDMSGIVSGKVSLEWQPVDLPEVVALAVETVRPTAHARQVSLALTVAPAEDGRCCQVAGDPGRLQQVLWNLLTNALKFTPPGGRIDVRLARAGEGIELLVRDDGEGIAPDFLPFVFDRFRQADASTTRRHGGLGLGLSIVKKLVELHGGTIDVRSEGTGRGAAFTVQLPALRSVKPPAPAPALPRAETAPGAPPAPQEDDADIRGLRILLVDDDDDGLGMTRTLLEHRQASVTTAASAAAALGLLAAQRFDVLISDIGMPDLDGYELLRQVHALSGGDGTELPALALSAYARPQDRERAIEAGFQRHLAKPVDPEVLVSAIAGVVRR